MFFSPDVVWAFVMPPKCQRSRRVSFRPELHPNQGGPLLCEALPRLRRVLALQPSPASHQMPPQLQLPGQQLRQHHLHLQQGDHASSELPRHQGGRDWIKGFCGHFSCLSSATTLKWMGECIRISGPRVLNNSVTYLNVFQEEKIWGISFFSPWFLLTASKFWRSWESGFHNFVTHASPLSTRPHCKIDFRIIWIWAVQDHWRLCHHIASSLASSLASMTADSEAYESVVFNLN